MRANLVAVFAGLLFGVGLIVSGMTNPAKVQGFLDLFGRWDPSLALVMAGAIAAHFTLRRLILRRATPLLAPSFDTPSRTTIDKRLVLGAAIFGVGWGLGGMCPGPGLVNTGTGSLSAIVFALFMALGIFLHRRTVPMERR